VIGFGDIEQQEIVEKDIRVGGERVRRPVGLAVVHVPVGQAVFQPLQEQRPHRLRDRERRLLIPQVAYILAPRQRGIVEPYVRLLRASDLIDAGDWRSDQAALPWGDRLRNRAEQRALRGVEHAVRIDLDDDGEHVSVLQQIWPLERGDVPGEIERVEAQPGEDAEIAVPCRRSP